MTHKIPQSVFSLFESFKIEITEKIDIASAKTPELIVTIVHEYLVKKAGILTPLLRRNMMMLAAFLKVKKKKYLLCKYKLNTLI